MASLKNKFWTFIILLIFILLFSLSSIAGLITDYWWFGALGFTKIFMISLETKIILFLAASVIFFIFAFMNLFISSRFHREKKSFISMKLKFFIVLVISVFIGIGTSQNWFMLLQYFMQQPFNITEPIFNMDVAFYVFSLPFLLMLWNFLMSCIIFTAILVVLDYFQVFISNLFGFFKGPYQMDELDPVNPKNMKVLLPKLKRSAILHLTLLLSLFFILLAGKHYLTRYSIMYSEKGIVVGAGYTDVIVFLPIIKILMVLAIAITVLFYVWLFYISKDPKLKKRHIIATALILYLIFNFIAGITFGAKKLNIR